MKQRNKYAHNNRQINRNASQFLREVPSTWQGTKKEWTNLLGEMLARPIRGEKEEA